MHGKWFPFVGMALFLTVGTLRAAAPQKDDMEVEDIKLGEQAIAVSMAVASAELHVNQGLKGPGPNPFDLGMAVIGARNSQRSLRALAGLVRFRFDGYFGEEYDRRVLAKGSKIKNMFRSLKPEELHEQCAHEFADLQKDKSYAGMIRGAKEGEVCNSVGSMKKVIQGWLHDLPSPHGHNQ